MILRKAKQPTREQDKLEYLRLFPRRARVSVPFQLAREIDFWPGRYMHRHNVTGRLVSDALPGLSVELDHVRKRYIIRRS